MKILVVCQHYWPENFRVTEICEALAARGHQVTALVGLPNYPSGVVPAEYRHFRNRRQMRNGVEIRRCFEIGRRPGKLGLAVNYVSYMTSATVKALLLGRDYDVIYAYSTSPVLMSLPAAVLRCFTSKKLMIYVLDIWPACLAAMNVGEDALLYRFMKRVSRWVYRRADMLIYSSKRFQGYLRDVHGIEVPDAQYMPQFADDVFRAPLPPGPASDGINLVFAGNIGKVQAVEVLIRSAALLRDLPIRWHIVGDGSNEAACRELAAKLALGETVVFYGRRPLEDMPAFYAMADAMLVSMRDDISVNDTLPGKVQSYMAAGKPVLGSIAGETAYVIEQAGCGFCAPPDDPEAFAQVVRRFLSCEDREAMGERGRAYYDANFTKRDHMDRLEALLIARLVEADGGECRIGYGVPGIAPEAQPYACRVGAPWERKLHGAMRKLLDAEGYGSVLGTRRLIRDMERFDPDIIHLHNLHGCYLNLPMIFRALHRMHKPVLSMLADVSAGSKNVTIALSSAPIPSALGWMGPAAIIK